MMKFPKIDLPYLKSKLQVKSPWDRIIIMLLSLFITIPIFIILHQNLIDLEWAFNLDRVFIFVFVFAAIFFLLIGGLLAMIMRGELITPENDLVDRTVYNGLYTMHGTIMLFMFIVPVLNGVNNLFMFFFKYTSRIE